MTEAEWLAATDANKVFKVLRRYGNERKFRLVAAAAVQRVEQFLSSHICRLSLDLAYRMADEVVPEDVAEDVRRATWEYIRAAGSGRSPGSIAADGAVAKAIHPLPDEAVRMTLWETTKCLARHEKARWPDWREGYAWAGRELLSVVRDIFGNPFRPVAFDPAWRTSTAVGVARAIYDDRVFDRLPILADALQDAGCEDAAILGHCRGDGPHARGCWVVDLVLGKE